jgi:DNA polymerase III sliding clamp (beta) subunit (PCNA family)
MKTNREELLKNLELLRPGLAQKEIIEQSTCFVFHEGRALTYNDEIAVSHDIDIELEGAVKAKEMLALLGKLKDEEVEMTVKGAELIVKGKRAEAGITMENEILLPVDDISIPEKFKKLPKGFAEAVAFCVFSAGKDLTRPALTCIHMTELIVESSDGHRITRYGLEEGGAGFKKPVLLPADAAAQLAGFNLEKYALDKSWIHFKTTKGTVISCRIVEGDFPHDMITQYLEIEGPQIGFPDSLSEMLDRAGVFTAEASSEQVVIEVKGSKMTISGKGPSGWYKEACRAKSEGDFKIGISPAYLKAIIEHGSTAIIGESLVKFEGGNFEHAVMQMVLEEETVDPNDDIPF